MTTIKKYKICRRLGAGIYEKCQTQKYMLSEGKKARSFGKKRRRRMSDFGMQLLQKQRVRFLYGVSEKQFRRYVDTSMTVRGMLPADALFTQLEKRLDNVVFRLGLAASRRMARQMVSHGHFTINGKKIDVPSYSVKDGDVVAVREGSKQKALFDFAEKKNERGNVPSWLKFDAKALSANVTGQPSDPDSFLNFQSVIEFYTR